MSKQQSEMAASSPSNPMNLFKEKRFQEAVDLFLSSPKNGVANWHYNLGRCYEELGRADKAWPYFCNAYKLNAIKKYSQAAQRCAPSFLEFDKIIDCGDPTQITVACLSEAGELTQVEQIETDGFIAQYMKKDPSTCKITYSYYGFPGHYNFPDIDRVSLISLSRQNIHDSLDRYGIIAAQERIGLAFFAKEAVPVHTDFLYNGAIIKKDLRSCYQKYDTTRAFRLTEMESMYLSDTYISPAQFIQHAFSAERLAEYYIFEDDTIIGQVAKPNLKISIVGYEDTPLLSLTTTKEIQPGKILCFEYNETFACTTECIFPLLFKENGQLLKVGVDYWPNQFYLSVTSAMYSSLPSDSPGFIVFTNEIFKMIAKWQPIMVPIGNLVADAKDLYLYPFDIRELLAHCDDIHPAIKPIHDVVSEEMAQLLSKKFEDKGITVCHFQEIHLHDEKDLFAVNSRIETREVFFTQIRIQSLATYQKITDFLSGSCLKNSFSKQPNENYDNYQMIFPSFGREFSLCKEFIEMLTHRPSPITQMGLYAINASASGSQSTATNGKGASS